MNGNDRFPLDTNVNIDVLEVKTLFDRRLLKGAILALTNGCPVVNPRKTAGCYHV